MTQIRDLDGPRPARPDEREEVLRVVNEVHRLSKGRRPTVADDYPHVYGPANIRNVLVVRCEGRVVCSVGLWINETEMGLARLRVGGINCLATLPEYRRRGLGRALMQASHEHLRASGCHVGLLGTAITNWYRQLGWEGAGMKRTYLVDGGNLDLLPRLPDGVTMRRAGLEAIGDALRIREAERLGGRREPAAFGNIAMARGRPDVVLGEASGEPVAYLLARGREIVEWGGPAPVVAALLRAWYEATRRAEASTSDRDTDGMANEQPLAVPAPATGHGLMPLLDAIRIPFSAGGLRMMYVVNPVATLSAYGAAEIDVREDGERVVLKRDAETAALSRPHLAKLFFGPEQVSHFAEDVFPLPFWQWPLEYV